MTSANSSQQAEAPVSTPTAAATSRKLLVSSSAPSTARRQLAGVPYKGYGLTDTVVGAAPWEPAVEFRQPTRLVRRNTLVGGILVTAEVSTAASPGHCTKRFANVESRCDSKTSRQEPYGIDPVRSTSNPFETPRLLTCRKMEQKPISYSRQSLHRARPAAPSHGKRNLRGGG